MRALVAGGADVNLADNCGVTPLWWAANNGQLAAAEALVAAGADVDRGSRRGADVDTPEDTRPKWVDVDRAGGDGETPLYRASFHGYERVVALLLRARADKALASDAGLRPADVVCAGGNKQNANAIAALLR